MSADHGNQPATFDAGLAKLSQMVLAETTLSDVLQGVADLSTQVPGCDHAGVTLVGRKDRFGTAAASSQQTLLIDNEQYESGEGPCLDAVRTDEVITISDLESDYRFPTFRTGALANGLRCSLSMPLKAGGSAVGALNLYSETPNAYDDTSVAAASRLAHQAAVVLANAKAHAESSAAIDQLNEALERRGLIEQAKGILMVREGVDADGAFDMLRKISQKQNERLFDVAVALVEATVNKGKKN